VCLTLPPAPYASIRLRLLAMTKQRLIVLMFWLALIGIPASLIYTFIDGFRPFRLLFVFMFGLETCLYWLLRRQS
jgi:hypothetical protein